MSTFGKSIIISLFGESHGPYVGITIHNFPAGIPIPEDEIKAALSRRRPKDSFSTSRQEQDNYKWVSGVFNGKTTGAPLTILLPNNDTKSKDYNQAILRPSHADFTANIRYDGYNDYRGGGHFSGRLTAPLVVLGVLCDQILSQKRILVSSHIASVHNIKDQSFNTVNPDIDLLKMLKQSDFPVINPQTKEKFKQTILQAKNIQDSVGGVIETIVTGMPTGYGDPFFEKVESIISHLLFSIPSVKGLEFGAGFNMTEKFGSDVNDSYIIEKDSIKTTTNNSGGIQGGITNGMPITFKTAIKPTPSIGKAQRTVNLNTMQETVLKLKGRHDPAIIHRVVHVINALTSYAMLELIARKDGI